MIVVRVASSSLPKAVFFLGTARFVLCVAGTLVALGVFFWYDTDFWDYFSVGPILRVAAALLSGFVISSGMLFWHYRRQESYITLRGNVFPELLVPFAAQSPLDRSGAVLPLRGSPWNRLRLVRQSLFTGVCGRVL
jgi:hypothetical protein